MSIRDALITTLIYLDHKDAPLPKEDARVLATNLRAALRELDAAKPVAWRHWYALSGHPHWVYTETKYPHSQEELWSRPLHTSSSDLSASGEEESLSSPLSAESYSGVGVSSGVDKRIRELALKAGLANSDGCEIILRTAIAEEREACAQECEKLPIVGIGDEAAWHYSNAQTDCAIAIRARGHADT